MTEDQFGCVDSLSETVKSIQNCLQCTICLEMMSSPAKTRCGHTFCRTCIGTVLNKKNSKCPLCNANLQRRSISKDKHTELCINNFELLVQAIQKDINMDILSHTKNPRNTREGYPTPKVRRRSTNDKESKIKSRENILSFLAKMTPEEQSAGPSNRDILDETSASCSAYKKDNAIKKDDSAERRNERKESSSDGLSGVYPLRCSPRKNEKAEDEVIFAKEERVECWLETLPDTELLENPDQEPHCLDDTITVISEFSSVSCARTNIKKEDEEIITMEHVTERDSVQERFSDSTEAQRLLRVASCEENDTRNKNKRKTTRSLPQKEIKIDSTEHKLKYERIHAKVRERCTATIEKSAKTSGDPLISTTDAADSSKHLTDPGNTTRETWNTVVQFGKEMRTKRNKLKSLDVSVQSTSGSRLSDEFTSNRTTKNRKVSTTNLQIRSKNFGQNDSIEKQNENNRLRNDDDLIQHISPPENQISFESKQEQQIQQNTSFISLDEEGRVSITSLRREQMNDIIGITSNMNKNTDPRGSTENLTEDHSTVPKKRLSLRRRSECSKNSDRSSPQITPIKVNLEERYELLRGSPPLLSPKHIENTPTKSDGTSLKTESVSKLSLRKKTPNSAKLNDVPISYDVSQLSSVKCNLMEQMNRSEVKRKEGVGNAETTSKIDQERRYDVREKKKLELDTKTNLATPSSSGKTHVVLFSKLGKVFRKRRKVKFYKLGSLRRESATCTLSTSISNASRVNVIPFLPSEDTLETSKTSEEECNLENEIAGSSINRIDVVDKKNDEIKSTKYRSESQESLGVLLVSLKDEVPENKRNDNAGPLRDISKIQQRSKVDFGKSSKKVENISSNRKEIRIPEQKEAHSKPVIISVVKMMSPTKDSQLKFLHLDSPSNTVPERMFIQRTTESERNSVQKLPANSSGQSNIVSNDNTKKRKRLLDIADKEITDNVCERVTKSNKYDLSSENDSDRSDSSENVTQIDKFNENVNKHVKTRRSKDNAVISLNSDDSNPKSKKTKDAPNESRKQYKRIVVPTSGSDTDVSTEKTNIIDNRKNDKNVSTVKRKRAPSTDYDSDTVVDKIMTKWCSDLDTSKRSSKKLKELKETKITKAEWNKNTVQPPESLNFDSWNNFLTFFKRDSEKELHDRSNNDIIDKVKLIRMNENIENISKKKQDAIDDNFDEAMAQVMSHSLGTHFFSNESAHVNSKQPEKESSSKNEENRVPLTSSYVETNDLFTETNRSRAEENSKDFEKTLMENLNESNKENDVKEENARFLGNNGQRDTSVGGVKLTNERKIDKPFEDRSTPMSVKNKNQTEEAKQDYEYDSLMNVTQEQLLLKALEEDLFGPANSRSLVKSTAAKTLSPERRLEGDSRTPRKMGKRNLGNKDAESSSDENDIIENTPQSQKKFMEVDHGTESKARKSLNVSQTTPVSRKNFNVTKTTTAMTPSTLIGKLQTPIDQNKIRPLYQSTPKIIQPISNREKELTKFVEKNKKALESITGSKERSMMQVKEESPRNAKHDKRELCFVWSSLAAIQIESIKKLAILFGASCTQNFTPAVTHVIVSTKEENNAATKTLKFLQGIAYRKFVVGFKWVADCLREGRLLDEEPYEAVDCYTLEPGPRKSRLRQSNLFNEFAFLCVEPFPNITVTQCQDLLKGVGATIVQNIDALVAVKNMHKVILLQNEAHKDEVVANWYKKTNAVPVSCDWLVECISQYKLVSCYMYLHEIVPEDILKSGYPEEMIDPEEFNSTCDTSAGH